MRQAIGQAITGTARLLHFLVQLGVSLGIAGLGLALLLAWRLAQGPLEVPWLVDRLEAAANDGAGITELKIGHAALTWEGFSEGLDRPLDIIVTDITIKDANGRPHASLPRAAVSLALGALLVGEIQPRAIELDGLRLRVLRAADGAMQLDLGTLAETIDDTGAVTGPDPAKLAAAILDMFARPPSAEPEADLRRYRALTRLRIRNGAASMVDRQLGTVWQVPEFSLDMRRAPAGGAKAEAKIALKIGDQSLALSVSADVPVGGSNAAISARLTQVRPAQLATSVPALASLAALDAPIDLSASFRLGAALDVTDLKLAAEIGTGRAMLGTGSLPILGANIAVSGSLDRMAITVSRLALTLAPGAVTPTIIAGHATVSRAAGRIAAQIEISLDQVGFADLDRVWPPGVGGKGARIWITENLTDGIAHNLALKLGIEAAEDMSAVTVTEATGHLQGSNITAHWLRPIPPIEHGVAELTLVSPDRIDIAISAGSQAGTGLVLRDGLVVITNLSGEDAFADISAEFAGPAADLVGILQHPRLHLFDKNKIDLRNPKGEVAGKLAITALPLVADVKIEQVHLKATGKVTNAHLTGIAAGYDLDAGMLGIVVDNDSLKLRGTATIAAIPTTLAVDMDFRAGPPTQIIQKVTVSGTTDAAGLAGIKLDPSGLMSGTAAITAELTTRRNQTAEALVRADLINTVLEQKRLAFSKPADKPAILEARVQLARDRITGINRLLLSGSGIDVEAQIDFAVGRIQVVRFSRLRFGGLTEISGDVVWPRQPGDPWGVTIKGAALDASGEFGPRGKTATAPARDDAGDPWTLDARIDRVRLGEGRQLYGVNLRTSNDGRITRQARVTARTAPNSGAFDIQITPGVKGRTLAGTAEDAGALLIALDVIDDMRGGKLTLSGTYDDAAPQHPLSGRAQITDYRLHNAPGLGRLLQAITVYGIFEAAQSSDLGFSQMIAPFRLTGDTLEIMDGQAFSASLGFTGKGRLDLARRIADVQGTVVPAYFLNSLLGRIPLIGKLLSAEKGGGLLAIGFSVRGPFDDPSVLVNPLTAVAPGFLRNLFGIFDGTPTVPAPGAPPAPAAPVAPPRPPPDPQGSRN
jgi:hypothetical protein